jgi:hypothetical protein
MIATPSKSEIRNITGESFILLLARELRDAWSDRQ